VDLGLSGKAAIVAASSKGLGKASALALAREGARVTRASTCRTGSARASPA
jgi:3-oxoacyl-[acyl-carrier protein] reductase